METPSFGTEPSRAPGAAGSGTEALKGQAAQLQGQVERRAKGAIDEGKDQVCEALDRVAGALDDSGSRVGGIAADYARRGSAYLRGRSADELWSSAAQGIRARPAALVGATFLGGFALARLLRR